MRRVALLGLTLALPGCAYVGNPFTNFGDFVGDTHTVRINPNRPVGHSENMLRVMGRPLNTDPLLPEPGNIWPGPQPQDPTLADIERQQNQEQQPGAQPAPGTPPTQPTPPSRRRGSSTPPGDVPAGVTVPPAAPGPTGLPQAQPAPRSNSLITPQGPVTTTPGGNGITNYTGPGGRSGIVVPNGNGTSTLIGPDGSVSTVPNPR